MAQFDAERAERDAERLQRNTLKEFGGRVQDQCDEALRVACKVTTHPPTPMRVFGVNGKPLPDTGPKPYRIPTYDCVADAWGEVIETVQDNVDADTWAGLKAELERRLETLLEAVGEAYRDNADGAVGNQLRAEGYEE